MDIHYSILALPSNIVKLEILPMIGKWVKHCNLSVITQLVRFYRRIKLYLYIYIYTTGIKTIIYA